MKNVVLGLIIKGVEIILVGIGEKIDLVELMFIVMDLKYVFD